jgi:hypothetical protein
MTNIREEDSEEKSSQSGATNSFQSSVSSSSSGSSSLRSPHVTQVDAGEAETQLMVENPEEGQEIDGGEQQNQQAEYSGL